MTTNPSPNPDRIRFAVYGGPRAFAMFEGDLRDEGFDIENVQRAIEQRGAALDYAVQSASGLTVLGGAVLIRAAVKRIVERRKIRAEEVALDWRDPRGYR